MPLVLIATPGAADANSFLTLAEADVYMEGRPFSDAWPGEESFLIWATRILNTVCWTGSAATSTQRLTWPRNGMATRTGFAIDPTVVPQDLKDATAEFSFLLSSGDPTKQLAALAQGLTRLKAGPVEFEWDPELLLRTVAPGVVIPQSVLDLLVPSWLCSVAAVETLMFEVV